MKTFISEPKAVMSLKAGNTEVCENAFSHLVPHLKKEIIVL